MQPFPLPGDLPDPGIEPSSLTSFALAGEIFVARATWEASYVFVLLSMAAEESYVFIILSFILLIEEPSLPM